jgi:DNA-binding CsgD family transcriptional regulator/tetratricopeptide (TPR) repeat protein
VEALPQATQRLLQVAAVAGGQVDHHLLAEVAAQPPERLVELLREAVAHHVLVVEGSSGGYAFRHALVQEAIYDDLLPVQRPPLHTAYARALAARIEGEGGAGAGELGRLAYHWYAAHDLGRALLASVRAGHAAEAAFALAEAADHYERALAAHGQMLMLWSRNRAAQARCEEAVAVARQVGARAVEGHGLNSLGSSLGNRGQLEDGVARLEQARAIAAELGDPDDLCRAHHNLGCVYLINGRCEEAARAELECLDQARRFGSMGSYGLVASATAAQALLWLGRWEEAERLLDGAFDLDLDPRGRVDPLLSRGLHRLWRGDLEGARTDLTWILERWKTSLDPQESVPARAWLATGATWEGRPEDARAAVADGLASLAEVDQPDLVAELCLAGLAAEAALAGRAAARCDEKAHDQASGIAAGLLERARAAAGADGVAIDGAVRAKLLTIEAEWTRVAGPGDPDRWAEAAGAWDELGCPWPAAYARWRLAEALLGRGAPREEAAVPLRRAWATARGLGARPLRAEAELLARRSRITLAPEPVAPGQAGSAEAQPMAPGEELGLTPREREVLALVAEGRTNRQIAEALFITDKTASVHVSNILAKLGVANRAEAAATVHRLGLTG